MKINKKLLIRAALISFLYVGFSTYSLLGMSPQSPIFWEWSALGLLITMPVSFIGFGLMYGEWNPSLLILVQTGIFFLFWLIVYRVLLKRHKKKRGEKK